MKTESFSWKEGKERCLKERQAERLGTKEKEKKSKKAKEERIKSWKGLQDHADLVTIERKRSADSSEPAKVQLRVEMWPGWCTCKWEDFSMWGGITHGSENRR